MSKKKDFEIEYTPGKARRGGIPSVERDEDAQRKIVHMADGKGRLKGVFSTQSVEKVGTGTTVRKTIQKTFWMVMETDDGSVDIQPLNNSYIPSGPKRKVAKEDVLARFQPEPEFYVQTVYPRMRELNRTVVKGEAHRAKGEQFSAELEFNTALAVDEENVRANFGLGLIYLERGETAKADNIFERLVKLDAAFEEQHKHLFNDFGINLRKNKMYDQALAYYQRALQMTKHDEHLYYNMARAYYEEQNIERCVEFLNKALRMNSNFEAARKFLTGLEEQGLISEGAGAKGDKPAAEKGTEDKGEAVNLEVSDDEPAAERGGETSDQGAKE